MSSLPSRLKREFNFHPKQLEFLNSPVPEAYFSPVAHAATRLNLPGFNVFTSEAVPRGEVWIKSGDDWSCMQIRRYGKKREKIMEFKADAVIVDEPYFCDECDIEIEPHEVWAVVGWSLGDTLRFCSSCSTAAGIPLADKATIAMDRLTG